jgi:hypothetical protein
MNDPRAGQIREDPLIEAGHVMNRVEWGCSLVNRKITQATRRDLRDAANAACGSLEAWPAPASLRALAPGEQGERAPLRRIALAGSVASTVGKTCLLMRIEQHFPA